MRNPSRKAAISAALLVVGAVAGWIAWHRYHADGVDWIVIVLFAMVVVITPFAPVVLIQGVLFGLGKVKLDAGVGRIAQWHVPAAEWDKFRAFDHARVAAYGATLLNDLTIREVTPPEGVEVVVGKTSLIVDGSYHVLRLNGLPELRMIGWLDNAATPNRPPDCLEFKLVYPRSRYGTATTMHLRVPIPADAFEQAKLAYYHFLPMIERRLAARTIALINPLRTLQVCGGLLLAGLAAIGWAFFEADRLGRTIGNTDAPLVVLFVAGGVAACAMIVGAATLLLRPKPPA
jgi:hypothetical protein